MSVAVASNDHSHLSQPRRRRAEGPPSTLEAAEVRSLHAVLDRGRADNVARYQHSITSILGDDSIDTSVFGGDSAAGASILEDLSLHSSKSAWTACADGAGDGASRGGGDYLARAGHRKPKDIDTARLFTYVSCSSRGGDSEASTARGHGRTDVWRRHAKKQHPPCSSKKSPEDTKINGTHSASKKITATASSSETCEQASFNHGGIKTKRPISSAGTASANDNKKGGRAHGERNNAVTHQKFDPPSKPEIRSRAKGQGRNRDPAARSRDDGGASPAHKSSGGVGEENSHAHASTSDDKGPTCAGNKPKTRGRGSAITAETCPSVASEASGPTVRYRVGDTRVSPNHSARLPPPAVAEALLAELPLGSPLFVRRSNQRFTYAVLVRREREGDSGTGAVVVALDAAGKQTKVLERRHWQTCLRLVNTREVGDERRRCGNTR